MMPSYDYQIQKLMTDLILGALSETGNNKSAAAKILRVKRTRLVTLCKKYFPEKMKESTKRKK